MSTSSRARPSATVLSCGLLAVCLALSGCGDDATSGNKDPDDGSGNMDAVKPSVKTERGATIVDAPPLHVAANDMVSRAPMDAAPTADGERVYYTALGQAEDGSSVPGIFATDAAGGGEIETLVLGDPLTAPVGIGVSPDGSRLFIADSAWTAADGNGAGAIVTLASEGGTPSALSGTEGFVPRGLVIADVSDETWLYFTGVDPESGESGVFRTSLEGGSVQTVASGEPFVDPAGVTVTSDGVAYVIDALASSDQSGQASLIMVVDGEAERMVEGLGVGFPAGIASTTDASVVLISGLDPVSRRDRVFLFDTKSHALSVITEPFDAFTQPAGLHRAHDENTFAWADSEANGGGTVYVVEM